MDICDYSDCQQLGVIVGLISTCVQSVGLTLQRKSHILEEEKEEHLPRRAPYRRRRWQIGMLLFLLSNIVGSSIQITTLPLPLLSTLQASGLVFNALLASLLLHEPFTRRTALGTFLVAAGAILISYFSALPEPSHTLDQLLDLLTQKFFLIWFSLTLLLVVGINAGTFFLSHIIPAHKRRGPRTRLIKGMSYGLVSGILSAHALLLAKSAVELLVRTVVDKKNQFNRYQSWLLLLAFLVLALSQLYYLHHGLKLVSTSILYPFVFCIYNIIAILDGLIYFRQADLLGPLHGGLIALGTAVLLSGVLALSWRLSEEPSSSDDPDTPVIERIKVDLPHTALAPGMGLVDEEANNVRTPLRSYFDGLPPSAYRDDEDESAISEGRSAFPARYYDDPLSEEIEDGTDGAHNHEVDTFANRRRPTTSSTRKFGSLDRRAAAQRRRRSTIKEVQAVWDELRDERNWFPPQRAQFRNGSGTRSEQASPSLTTRFKDSLHDDADPHNGDDPVGTRSRRSSNAAARRRGENNKRRTAPPGAYTFDNVGTALSAKQPAVDREGRLKRTVSWGQVRHIAEPDSPEDLISPRSNAAAKNTGSHVRDASAPPAAAAAAGTEVGGAKDDDRHDKDQVVVGSGVGSPSATSSADHEDKKKKGWMGSVKLDWWRKKRRDDDHDDEQ